MNDPVPPPDKTRLLVPRLRSGENLRHYRLERLLGEGGMGLVYQGYDTRLHRPVAVKLLPTELTNNPETKQRLIQEARAAARISHPAIAQIFDADEQEGMTFIVMELVEGKTIQDLIQRHELDLLGAIEIAIQVAEGLAKAHQIGIVHRDIKPANIMLTNDGHAKILDFGLAKVAECSPWRRSLNQAATETAPAVHTQPGTLMGTPAYMSPEQVRGLPVDFRSDLFSFGLLLLGMATGQSPFLRANMVDTLHAVAFEEVALLETEPATLPAELRRLIARCLKKNPEERYSSAKSLVQDLRKLRRDLETGLARQTTWRQWLAETWEQLPHWPLQHYVWAALGLAGLGALLYYSFIRISTGGLLLLLLAGTSLYRHLRNRRQQIQELFVRKTAKIPEVRVIAFQGNEITVVVDRPVAQLYGRINRQLGACNRKLYWGLPMTASIVHDLPPTQLNKILTSSGVHYVRQDVVERE